MGIIPDNQCSAAEWIPGKDYARRPGQDLSVIVVADLGSSWRMFDVFFPAFGCVLDVRKKWTYHPRIVTARTSTSSICSTRSWVRCASASEKNDVKLKRNVIGLGTDWGRFFIAGKRNATYSHQARRK
jgi:hypothetical protein